jgi:ParB-like chromosome segregation protein Spo0J
MSETKSVFAQGSRVSIFKFKPQEIAINPAANGRHDLPDIEWLIRDIAAVGQLEPVLVRKDGDKPVLVAGFSRWRAIVEINKRKLTEEPLPILASYFRGNEVEGLKANIRENRFRNSTTPLDDAHNIIRLLNYQMDHESVARLYFPQTDGDPIAVKKAIGWVKKTAKLAQLTPEAEEAIRRGDIKPSAASHIAELASEIQRDLVKKGGKVTASSVRKASGKKVGMSLSEVKRELTAITEKGKLPTGAQVSDAVVEWLEALILRM